MADRHEDPLAVGSGLFEGRARFVEPRFEFNPDYNDGQTLILATELTPVNDDDHEAREQRFPCGDGWTTTDKGKTAEREDGGNKPFNGNSYIGQLVGQLVTVAPDETRARLKDVPEGPYASAFWDGLDVEIEQVEVEFKSLGYKGNRYKIVKFYGFGNNGAGKATKATKKTAKKAASTASGPRTSFTDAEIAKLDAIADESENKNELLEGAIKDGIVGPDDAELHAIILDDRAEDGIWQRAVKRYEEAQANA